MSENAPWMTVITCLLAMLFTIVGGIVTFVQPDTLSFDQYLERTGQLALAVAALGVGRSLKKGIARSAGGDVGPGWLERAPVATYTIALMVLVVGVTGGVLTIVDPARLPFDTYLEKLNTFAFAVGLQGAGRAVRKGLEKRGEAQEAQAGAVEEELSGFALHPDSPLNPATIVPEPIPAAPDFVDPADLASADDDLGAAEEPTADVPVSVASSDGDLDEDDLPTDAEEEAAPPPPDPSEQAFALSDVYVLDQEEAVMPAVVQPSQDGELVR